MANPFLFDAPPVAPADNPFLSEATANPFLAEAPVQVLHHQQYAQQYMGVVAAASPQANPFAEYSAAPVQTNSAQALFGDPNSYNSYQQVPVQNYGQYSPAAAVDAYVYQSPAPAVPVSSPGILAVAAIPAVPIAAVKEQVAAPVVEERQPTPEPVQELIEVAPPPPPPQEEKEADIAEDAILPPHPHPAELSRGDSLSLPPPPPDADEEEQVAAETTRLPVEPQAMEVEQSDIIDEATTVELQQPEEHVPSPPPPEEEISESLQQEETKEAAAGPSTGASLFGLEAEPELEPEKDEEEEEKEPPPKMSTGDAIFADLPKADVTSTGASIFGLSEESAANTTGSTLFGVTAPRAAQPTLGSMSGWDDNFDRKFDSADATVAAGPVSVIPGDPFDPFVGRSTGFASAMGGVGGGGFDDNTFGQSSFNSSSAGFRPSGFAEPIDVNNPFLDNAAAGGGADQKGGEDGETDSPLFDDDTSKPLEAFPRLVCDVPGWEMFIRHPPKKKLTAQRYWKKIFVRIVMQGDTPCVQLFENKDAKDAFQELPLQAAYSLSDIAHQVFDQYSKIFTLKLQYIFYKERAGIRPGQISKMQKLTDKIGFLAKAVEDADYHGVKEFASDMKKLGVPLEHAPQISELLKLGSDNFEDLKQFSVCVEEKLFKMDVHRDRALTYKTEEVQLTAVEEVYVEQDKTGHVIKQLCRVRVFFLSFLTGMPDVELGVNDLARMGLEVVGRHDILPVPTEQWIRYEAIEFHSIVDKKEFEKNDHIIKFQPPDACYLEIMRFRVRPPKARELPMQARCQFLISGNKVEIRADMMIPYHHTKAWGQVPCEDVAMRIPLPECWIYQFRTEKHHVSLSQLAVGNLNIGTRMGSVKSAHRRAGKVKGLERFMGALETQTQDLMETSSGQAKYEHQHKAIVWRVPRLPKHGQGSYTNHEFVCKLTLTSFDQMPETFDKHFSVEFTQPATAISNTVLRSVSIQNGSGEPPEKFAKYLARHEYKLEIDFAEKEQNTYVAVTKRPVVTEEEEKTVYPDFPDEDKEGKRFSDSDSN